MDAVIILPAHLPHGRRRILNKVNSKWKEIILSLFYLLFTIHSIECDILDCNMDDRKKTIAALTIIVGIIVLVVIVIGVLVSRKKVVSPVPDEGAIRVIFISPTPVVAATVTPTIAPTTTVRPTARPQSTATPKPQATATPKPTATGGATPTVTVTPTKTPTPSPTP